jgi:predicted lipase
LGGALATLVGCYLYEIGIKPENLEIYTFGAPPVGTEEFCANYENKFNIFRLVNENDVVPKIDKITKFFHLGEAFILPSNEGEVHSCEGYIDNIIDVMESTQAEA